MQLPPLLSRLFAGRLAGLAVALAPAISFAATDPTTGRWVPGIGDPTPLGWVTVAAYIAAAALCMLNIRRNDEFRLHGRFWSIISFVLAALAINKQLDVQTLFTQFGRDLAIAQGWYDYRRVVQIAFIASLCLGALIIAAGLRTLLRRYWSHYVLVCTGITLLLAFIVIRATTFHHLDSLLGFSLSGISMNFLLEMTAIILVCMGALRWKAMNMAY